MTKTLTRAAIRLSKLFSDARAITLCVAIAVAPNRFVDGRAAR